jgi:hypothetical protein
MGFGLKTDNSVRKEPLVILEELYDAALQVEQLQPVQVEVELLLRVEW